MADKTVTLSRKQADDAIDSERVLGKILNDPTLDVTVNIGGYLVFFVDDGHGEVMSTIIDLTARELELCQRIQGGDDG